jgi:hypothetical protein
MSLLTSGVDPLQRQGGSGAWQGLWMTRPFTHPSRIFDAIQGHAARTAGDGYGDVTVKAMAMAMERVPRVDV